MSVYCPTQSEVLDFLRDHRTYTGAIALPGAPARPSRHRFPSLDDLVRWYAARYGVVRGGGLNDGPRHYPDRPFGVPTPPTTNMILWLKGDSETYNNVGGTTPASNGETVKVWGDQSPANNDMSQNGSGAVTLDTLNKLNGHNVLGWPGNSNDVFGPVSISATSVSTQFFVAKANFTAAVGYTLASGGNPNRHMTYGVGGGSNTIYLYAGSSVSNYNLGAVTAYQYYCAQYNGASSKFWVNGVQQGTTLNPGSGTMDALRIGANEINTGAWKGSIAEVIIYNAVLDASSIAIVHAYLADRFAL